MEDEIIFNIDVMLAKRKMSVTELSQKVGITMANISILKNGKAKAVKVSTLAKLCRALDCQPGDLLEYRPGEESVDEEYKTSGMAGHVWNQSFMYCDLYFYDRGNCNEGRQWLGTGPGCGFHRYAGGSQSAGSVLSAGVYCVFSWTDRFPWKT